MRGRHFLDGILWYIAGAVMLLALWLLLKGGQGLTRIINGGDWVVLVIGGLFVGVAALAVQRLEYNRPSPAGGARPVSGSRARLSKEVFSAGSLAFIMGAAFACAVTPADELIDPVERPRGSFEELVIDGDRDAISVVFDHDHANEKIGGSRPCGFCHHLNDPGEESTSCSECHRSMDEEYDIFDHERHMEHLGGNDGCQNCHSDPNSRRNREVMRPNCNDCHGLGGDTNFDSGIQPRPMLSERAFVEIEDWSHAASYQKALHELCIDCHEQRGERGEGGYNKGTRCPDCHRSGSVPMSDVPEPRGDD